MKYGDWTMGQTEALLNKLGGDESAMRILRNEVRVELVPLVKIITTFKVMVNYSQPIEQKTTKGFTYVNPNITSTNFPVDQSGEAELEAVAVNFGRVVTLDEVRRSFKEMDLRTGIPTELVDISKQNETKELDECLPMVSGDSVWVDACGRGYVADLDGRAGNRRLNLLYADGAWDGGFWFLGFRKCQ